MMLTTVDNWTDTADFIIIIIYEKIYVEVMIFKEKAFIFIAKDRISGKKVGDLNNGSGR